MIYGIGIDIVEVSRFAKALEKRGDKLRNRVFTEAELAYCMGQASPERHLAARFAAKVSVLKAFGGPLSFKDIEITRDGDGRPAVRVSGLTGDYRFSISIAHDGDLSIAETIMEKA